MFGIIKSLFIFSLAVHTLKISVAFSSKELKEMFNQKLAACAAKPTPQRQVHKLACIIWNGPAIFLQWTFGSLIDFGFGFTQRIQETAKKFDEIGSGGPANAAESNNGNCAEANSAGSNA